MKVAAIESPEDESRGVGVIVKPPAKK
jgi:hypothetical protein